MNLASWLRERPRASSGERPLPFDEWLSWFRFAGLNYPVLNQTMGGIPQAEVPPTFDGFSEYSYKRNSIVFSCIAARMMLFSEARFMWRPPGSVNNGDLFRTPALELLEAPWPRGSTRDLLTLMLLHVDIGGNSYVCLDYVNGRKTLEIARPDWVWIVRGSRRADGLVGDLDTETIGYIYRPMGSGDPKTLLPEQVAHFMPLPDPVFPFRGMSWLQPVIEEIMSDSATTTHKLEYFNNAATPNLVVNFGSQVNKEDFEQWVELFEDEHAGSMNAFKSIYLAGGADAKVVGSNLNELDFRNVQAHGETRVCNAARVPAIIVGVSEGLDSGTYSNFGQAKRLFADGTMRPLWGGATERLAQLIDAPGDATLAYDDRQIAFLAEDQKDAATIQQTQAATIKSLIDAGYKPDTVVKAVQSGDFSQLVHTGLYSVQLQPPGTTFTPTQSLNGTGNGVPVPAGG